jgi:hypothetical protein
MRIDWEWNINNDDQDGDDISYMTIEIDDDSDTDSKPDNGFIMVGSTVSEDSLKDAWIVRLDANGIVVWSTDTGGAFNDLAQAVQQVNSLQKGYTKSR